METAEQVVKDILQEVLVYSSEQPLEAVDFEFVVRYMNRYMAQLAVTVPLGYTKVVSPNDLITIPDGAMNGLIFNVALRVLNSFDVSVGQELKDNAKDGLMTMRKLAANPVVTKHPSTLPIGSGNYCEDTWQTFYEGETDNLLTEQSGDILLEGN